MRSIIWLMSPLASLTAHDVPVCCASSSIVGLSMFLPVRPGDVVDDERAGRPRRRWRGSAAGTPGWSACCSTGPTWRVAAAPTSFASRAYSIGLARAVRPRPRDHGHPARAPARRRRGSPRLHSSPSRVGLSPVVPTGTRPCTPPSIWKSTRRRSAFSSTVAVGGERRDERRVDPFQLHAFLPRRMSWMKSFDLEKPRSGRPATRRPARRPGRSRPRLRAECVISIVSNAESRSTVCDAGHLAAAHRGEVQLVGRGRPVEPLGDDLLLATLCGRDDLRQGERGARRASPSCACGGPPSPGCRTRGSALASSAAAADQGEEQVRADGEVAAVEVPDRTSRPTSLVDLVELRRTSPWCPTTALRPRRAYSARVRQHRVRVRELDGHVGARGDLRGERPARPPPPGRGSTRAATVCPRSQEDRLHLAAHAPVADDDCSHGGAIIGRALRGRSSMYLARPCMNLHAVGRGRLLPQACDWTRVTTAVFTTSSTERAARQVAHRLGEALEERAVGLGAGEALHELVADVAALQVGEHEGVRLAGHRRAGRLLRAPPRRRAPRRPASRRRPRASGRFSFTMLHRARHLVHQGVARAALGGEGEQGDERLGLRGTCGRTRPSDRAISASCSAVGSGTMAQSAKIMWPSTPHLRSGEAHDEARGGGLDAGARADDREGGAQDLRGLAVGARDHGVGPALDASSWRPSAGCRP